MAGCLPVRSESPRPAGGERLGWGGFLPPWRVVLRTELVWIYNCLIFYYRVIAYGDNVLSPYSAVARVGLGPGLVGIPAGTFTMGSPDSEPVFLEEERPQTEVKLTRAFWMSRYETTQEAYFSVMKTYHSRFTTRDYK